jgi:hypothetical protein
VVKALDSIEMNALLSQGFHDPLARDVLFWWDRFTDLSTNLLDKMIDLKGRHLESTVRTWIKFKSGRERFQDFYNCYGGVVLLASWTATSQLSQYLPRYDGALTEK